MSSSNQVQMFFSLFVAQIPTLLVCGIGFMILLARSREVGRGVSWALFGFGLGVFIGIAAPLSQMLVQNSIPSGGDPRMRMWIMSGMSLLWSVLRAVSYACLLVALLTRRPAPPPPMHPYVDGSFRE